MKVTETTWGRIVNWGYNCEEHLRDLRKLNAGVESHHPDWDSFCRRSDDLNAKILVVLGKLDRLCKRNSGKIWSNYTQKRYDALIGEFTALSGDLENLCVYEYPAEAHKYHYSYCV